MTGSEEICDLALLGDKRRSQKPGKEFQWYFGSCGGVDRYYMLGLSLPRLQDVKAGGVSLEPIEEGNYG